MPTLEGYLLRRSLSMFHHSPLMLHHSPLFFAVFSRYSTIFRWCSTILPSMFEVQGNRDFSLGFQFRFSASYHFFSFDFIFVLLISISFSFSSFDFDFIVFDFDSDFTTFYSDSLLSISFLYFWFRFLETLLVIWRGQMILRIYQKP